MINNTLSSIEKITGQLKTLNKVRKFLTLILYSGYLVYRIVANNGYFALNICLLAVTVLYGTFYVYYVSTDKNTMEKDSVRKVNRVYRWSKHVLTGIGVGLNVSGFLAVADQGLTVQNLVFAIIMPAFLVLQIVFDIIYEYALYCFKLLKKGFMADVDAAKEKYEKPIQMVQNVRATVGGIKNVKDGVVGIASSFFKKRKKKGEPEPEEQEPLPQIAAAEEPPEVIEVTSEDVEEGKKS